ncbi:hypothetical protein GX48_02332 [Paracoccidioides brasiliensis]|nr:hypothetical protein GX48_02332 [Paracoccidioides brasiliensis]
MFPNDHTNTSDVMAHSHASREPTTSDFDPDHEALVSTRQLDNDHLHPQSKRANWDDAHAEQEPDPDFVINTSALHRAFPDFSDASSLEEEEEDDDEDEDDLSVEMGRAAKKTSQQLDDSRDSVMSVDGSKYSALPAGREGRFGSRSPRAPLRPITNRASTGRDSLRKDAQIRRASLAMKDSNQPKDIKLKSGSQRRTLSEIHAKVNETYDGSYISDERPAKVTLTTRNTRFSNRRTNDQSSRLADAGNKASGKNYLKHYNAGDVEQAQLRRQLPSKTTDSNGTTDNPTHQSYALPDIPDLSELVSGIYEDGTPKGRSRTTRFTSPPAMGVSTYQPPEHLPLDSIPVPDDEKAIFVSLKLLQEKVQALQTDKSDMEIRLEEMEEEILILRNENARLRKQDKKRFSMYGGDEDINNGGVGKLFIQKNSEYIGIPVDGMNFNLHSLGLEAANLALQNRLDVSIRKNSSHETTIKHLTQERDSARTQLGVAYLNIEELKLENDALAQENDEMRIQIESNAFPEAANDSKPMEMCDSKTKRREATAMDPTKATKPHRIRTKHAEDPDANGSNEQIGLDTRRRNSNRTQQDRSQPCVPSAVKVAASKQQKQAEYDSLFSLDLSHLSVQQSTQHTKMQANTTQKKLPNTSKLRTKKAVVEYMEDSNLSEEEMGTETRGFRNRTGPTNDLTFLSFIDANEIAKLRKTLEEERVARKTCLSRELTEQTKTGNFGTRLLGNATHSIPLKSSLKNTSSKASRPVILEATDFTGTEHRSVANTRDLSQHNLTNHSTSTAGPRRRLNKTEEMTSAFILPDITLHAISGKSGEPPKLSAAAQRVLNEVAKHDGKNCSVCKNVIDKNCIHGLSNREGQVSFKVTKPVPVSARVPEPSPYIEEPTLRPSQQPALALATVLKALEDELAHLKMQLVLQQTALNKHDASLRKKQRKSILRKFEFLLREIDTKSDQIYALYDVLEGQKEDGHEMTQQEVDVTLQSIGLGGKDGSDLTERLGHDGYEGKGVTGGANSDGDSDYDDPPWEGFESTGHLTGRNFSKKLAKSS